MEPDSGEKRNPVMDLAKKYGVTPGTMDHVTLGPVFVEPRRVVKLPDPQQPAPAAGQRRVDHPSQLEAALLDTIHRHHLQAALAMTDRRHDARGMLLAGYAYGLHDPVCNIVANSVLYDAVFPASSSQEEVRPRFLSCKAVFRLARRSLDALVAFLTVYAPSLTAEEAVSYLSRTHGNLHHATMLVDTEGVNHTDNMVDAFKAAILAAHLPSDAACEAQLWFMVNCAPADPFLARHGIRPGHPLAFGLSDLQGPRSNALILDFVKSALPNFACTVPQTPSSSSLSRGAYRALRLKMHGFRMDQEFCLNIANMAIQKLFSQFGVDALPVSLWE